MENLAVDFLWQVMRVVQLMTRLVTMKVGEESNPTNDDVSPVASEKNTVVSECMKDEYLEWPSCDFSASHDSPVERNAMDLRLGPTPSACYRQWL